MKRLKSLLTALLVCALTASTARAQEAVTDFDLTPRPQKLTATGKRPFTLTA